eukprot:gene2626-5528_t
MATETIVFVIDVSEEMNASPFNDRWRTSAIKKLTEFKNFLSAEHTYGLAALTSSMIWLLKPTTRPTFLDMLTHLRCEESFPDCVTMSFCRQGLMKETPHDQTVHAILVYSRSNVMPTDNRFILDVLYLFDRDTGENPPTMDEPSPKTIFDSFNNFDPTHNRFYIFGISTSLISLYQRIASFAANPSQRPPLDRICYDLLPTQESDDKISVSCD